jgi:hypothetical protein
MERISAGLSERGPELNSWLSTILTEECLRLPEYSSNSRTLLHVPPSTFFHCRVLTNTDIAKMTHFLDIIHRHN